MKGYPAFVVEIKGSECESKNDTDAEQLAIAYCTDSKVGESECLLQQSLIVQLQTTGRNVTELRRVVKSVLVVAEPPLLLFIHAMHV